MFLEYINMISEDSCDAETGEMMLENTRNKLQFKMYRTVFYIII